MSFCKLNSVLISSILFLPILFPLTAQASDPKDPFDSFSAGSQPSFSSYHLSPILDIDEVESFDQVTSVSQLSDVQPTDWAFQALQSLVERYGCIAGYPDGTFRGSRGATRYELAAALNACLDQISDRFATQEDLQTIRALQEEFATELATLRGRVDALEARTATLEAQQFSTTTKLTGLAAFSIAGATGNNIRANGVDGILPFRAIGEPDRDGANQPRFRTVTDDPNITFTGLVWLDLNTSFSGRDLLRVELAAGNGSAPSNAFVSAGLFNTSGVNFLNQTSGPNDGVAEFVLRELSYTFPVGRTLQVVAGPRLNFYRYFDNNRFTFFLNGANTFNSINSPLLNASKRGAGVVLLYTPLENLSFHLGYLSQSNEFLPDFLQSAPNLNEGLFGGTNTINAEVVYSPTSNVNLRAYYARSNIQRTFGGLIGGTAGLPLWGLADDGFGGDLNNATANTFGFNFDWLITSKFGLFGRYYYANTNLKPVDLTRPRGDVNNQSIQFGVAFLDLGREGAQGTISFVIPSDVLKGERFLISGGGDGGMQKDIEVNYHFPVNDNIGIDATVITILNANNFSNNDPVFVGTLRTTFRF
ncbi:iron uptake porin [Synechococcales cyanobacterium C]|uniref:Iron uptake porin n=1 Tax=Petrachloros mirabilis ULC683 TaxID=2781853 RepID=A0A8K1ZXV2_9CYAN|nr:iron uptake porin [Petrachloros mirabilis]NCJ05837.1 iron uptake porin [Petrachloros mirabilis ULC683]